jgi:LacI family transcriptional regulator
LESSHRPTAVFASSDQIAIGALLRLHEAGIHVPSEIAVASFDDSPDARFTWPPLTAVHQPLKEMAEDALILIMTGEGPRERMYEARLVVRESTVGASRPPLPEREPAAESAEAGAPMM